MGDFYDRIMGDALELDVTEVKLDSNDNNLLLEHEQLKQIPKTQRHYRVDKGNTNTLTQDHAHVYASKNGKQLYAVNVDGTGHDGYSGKEIPSKDAKFFRSQGFNIPDNNILECIEIEDLLSSHQLWKLLEENSLL